MKRNYVWAAALLMLAACSNEEVLTTTDNPDRGNEGQRVTVTATLPGNATRVTLQDVTENGKNIIKVAWAKSGEAFTVMTTDEQQVASEENDMKHVFTQTEGDQFTGTLPNKVSERPYYAIYPPVNMYDAEGEAYNYSDEQGDITSFSASKVPFNLVFQSGKLNEDNTLMYATSTDGGQFDFHHLTAIVKFTLTELPQEEGLEVFPYISWKGGCQTGGMFDLTKETVAEMYPTATDEEENSVFVGTTIQDGTATFYAYLPPIAQGKTLDISFSVIGKNNIYECTAQVELAKAIEPGMYYRATRDVTVETINRNMTAGSVEELQAWVDAFLIYNGTMNLTLTQDIDLSNADLDGDATNNSNWPAGLESSNVTIDGGGHTLTGLKMNVTGEGVAAAMFRSIDENAVVKNLHLRNVQLSNDGYYAAGVVADNYATVSGCSVSGSITSTMEGYSVGGVVGQNSGTVTACYNNATVSATESDTGGVVGQNSGTVTACYSTGAVSATGGSAGGVAGYNDATVTACYWSGTGVESGIGYNYETDGTTQVDGTTVTWNSTALAAMNTALPTGFGWQYKENTGTDAETFPLVLESTSASQE